MVNFYTYLELFLNDIHAEFNLSEFEGHFNKPHQTIKSHLEVLVEKKILIKEKGKRLLSYSLNKKNPLLFEYLSICEKQRLFTFLENSLFQQLYAAIKKHLIKNKVLIFGSAAVSQKFKDIDLLIISKDTKIKKTIKEFEQTYSVSVHIIQTDKKNITDSLLEEIRKKHIILNEHDFFIKLLHGKQKN